MKLKMILIGLAALALAGCSETKFLDKMGMGKQAPDETQVVRNQNLAMPPDLKLPPPSSAPQDPVARQPAQVASAPALATPDVASADPSAAGGTTYDTGAQQLSTNPDQPVASGKVQTASLDPATTAGQNGAVQTAQKTDLYGNKYKEDAYAKYGISKVGPDGKPKTQVELDKELLAAIKVEKRQKNPNYGTVFNIGNIFSGE